MKNKKKRKQPATVADVLQDRVTDLACLGADYDGEKMEEARHHVKQCEESYIAHMVENAAVGE